MNQVAIIGGGYAGLAVAIELSRLGYPHSATLFDPRPAHQKITQWHKLARGAAAGRYEESFLSLADRFSFRFRQQAIDVRAVLKNPTAALGETFSAVVVAQGSCAPAMPPGVVTLDELRDSRARQDEVRRLSGKNVAVIGGGPTGVQFAFEFAAQGNRVTLHEARDRLLPSFDNSLSAVALEAAAAAGIDVRLGCEFLRYENSRVIGRQFARESESAADFVLFVPGVKSTPAVVCDQFGRIETNPHRNLYAAGDNSYFSGRGLNTKSAQAAVRKGQQVARTIVADFTGKAAEEYTYGELGYFVSLGPKNAVGYLLSQKTAFSGLGALIMKEAIEKQYNLYLAGFNVYP